MVDDDIEGGDNEEQEWLVIMSIVVKTPDSSSGKAE